VLLPGERLDDADLAAIERAFAALPPGRDGGPRAPYLKLLVGDGLYDLERVDRVCADAGWERERRPLAVELLRDAPAFELPEGCAAEVSRFAEVGLPAEYRALLRSSFGADDAYLADVEGAYRDARGDASVVLLRAASGDVVAGGTVTVGGGLAFFSWGAVAPAYRGRGFHRPLVAACRRVAARAGARLGALATRQERIRGRGDARVELHICRRPQ
jgi:GNAT superfamily N-acetyltransferase